MRLATIRTRHGTHAVRLDDDVFVELGHDDVGALLRAEPDAIARRRVGHRRTARARRRRLRAGRARPREDRVRRRQLRGPHRRDGPRGARVPHPVREVHRRVDRRPRRHRAPSRVAVRRLGSRAGGGDRPAGPARDRARSSRGDRRVHGGQRRLDARLAEPHLAMAPGQDVRTRHAGRTVAGDSRRVGRRGARSRAALRGRRRRAPAQPHLAARVRPGRRSSPT